MKISSNLSANQIKRLAVRNFFEQVDIKPRKNPRNSATAVIMAGVPGSGKTEFLDSLIENLEHLRNTALRIDLDEVVKIFDDYLPEEDYKFRKHGSTIVSGLLKRAIDDGYSFILDGTFGGSQSIKNVRQAIRNNYVVTIYVMIEEIERAKKFTKIREKKTKRGIKTEIYDEIIDKISSNLKILTNEFKNNNKNLRIFYVHKNWSSPNEREYTFTIDFDLDEFYKK